MEKLFQLLVNPISKLEKVSEENSNKISNIEMMTMDIRSLQSEAVKELKQQTIILSDIREFIKERSRGGTFEQKDAKMANAAGFKPLTMKETGLAAFMVVGISAAIVTSAALFSFIPVVSPMQLLTAALIAVAFVAIAPAFVKIANVLSKMKGETSFEYAGFKGSKTDSSGIMPLVAGSLIAMIGISAAIAISSLILQLVVPVSPAKLITALLISIAMLPIGIAFSKIIDTLNKVKVDLGVNGTIIKVILGISTAIVASSLILQLVVPVSPIKVLTAFLIGTALIGISYAFSLIMKNVPKGMSSKDVLLITSSLVLMSLAIVASSVIMLGTAIPTPIQFLSFFLVGLALIPASFAFSMILKNMRRTGLKQIVLAASSIVLIAGAIVAVAHIFQQYPGDPSKVPSFKFISIAALSLITFTIPFIAILKMVKRVRYQDIVKASISLLSVAASIVAIGFIFQQYPGDPSRLPSVKFSLLAGLALFTFSFGFAALAKFMKRVSYKDMAKATVAVAFVAVAIVGTAWIFSYLNGVSAFIAPPYDWSLKSGLALLVFGGSYALISILTKTLGISTMLQGIIGVAVIALAILAVGWIFNMLAGVGWNSPPIEWSVGVALSLVAFTIPALVIGLIATSGIGAVGLLLGVVGMIVIAAGIWVVAWIFSKLPDLTGVSKMLTEALLTPVNGIVDVLKRLKEEVGVENLLPLAGGIIAISGSLLVLAAASAGAAAAGLGASLMNAGKAFIDFVSGSDTKGPLEILSDIINMAPQISKVAAPIKILGEAFMFLQGGQNMEVLVRFFEVMQKDPKMNNVKAIQDISEPMVKMINALKNLDQDAPARLQELFYSIKWSAIAEPIASVATSMVTLAKSANAAGHGVTMVAGGMERMVNALNRLTRDSIEKVIQLFNEVNWPVLVNPIDAISLSIQRMSSGAIQTGEGLLMASKGLQAMSAIPVEILKEIASVFNSIAKDSLTTQGQAIPIIAGSIVTISASMLTMRSDAFIRMFEVMASSSEAIVAMSKPMERIATSMDKMSRISVDGIEWAHKMARELARSSFNSQATALEKMAKSYASISKSSNSMDVEAINSTADMFKALAYLYQNGRRNAIEELGDKLVDAVKELASMIADFENTVKQEGEGSKSVGEALSKAADNLIKSIGIGGSSGGGAASNNTSNEELAMTMQELVDLLQTGQAKITITDLDPQAEAKLA